MLWRRGLDQLAGSSGDDRGIDHVASLVRLENFNTVGEVLTRQLGFSATPALLSPLRAKNRLIWFSDLSYLELATFTERKVRFKVRFKNKKIHDLGSRWWSSRYTPAPVELQSAPPSPQIPPWPRSCGTQTLTVPVQVPPCVSAAVKVT
jgi:hypothetical protein